MIEEIMLLSSNHLLHWLLEFYFQRNSVLPPSISWLLPCKEFHRVIDYGNFCQEKAMIFRKQMSFFSSVKLLLAWQNVCHMSYQMFVEKQQHEIL